MRKERFKDGVDEYFIKLRNRMDMVIAEKKRLEAENDRLCKENKDILERKQNALEKSREELEAVKEDNIRLLQEVERLSLGIETLRKDGQEKAQRIEAMKEAVFEYQKFEQKFKILESKYIYDVSSIKGAHQREKQSVE